MKVPFFESLMSIRISKPEGKFHPFCQEGGQWQHHPRHRVWIHFRFKVKCNP
jgi:hypothetical protein